MQSQLISAHVNPSRPMRTEWTMSAVPKSHRTMRMIDTGTQTPTAQTEEKNMSGSRLRRTHRITFVKWVSGRIGFARGLANPDVMGPSLVVSMFYLHPVVFGEESTMG